MNMLQVACYLIRQRVVSFVTAVNSVMFFSVLIDETQDRAKCWLLQVTACDPAEEMVRMTGTSVGNSLVTAMQQAGLVLDNRLCRLRLRWSICNVQWTRRRCSVGEEQSPPPLYQTIFIVRCIPL